MFINNQSYKCTELLTSLIGSIDRLWSNKVSFVLYFLDFLVIFMNEFVVVFKVFE